MKGTTKDTKDTKDTKMRRRSDANWRARIGQHAFRAFRVLRGSNLTARYAAEGAL
jgi:hypothetical protein